MKPLITAISLILFIYSGSYEQPARQYRHNVDSLVLSWHLTDYHDADELTDTLTSASDNDSEKVRAIYFWITQYISYDLKKYQNGTDISQEVNHDVDKDGYTDNNKMIRRTLLRKRGVCQDYADLFAYMCNYAGIKCEVISGLASNGSAGGLLNVMTGGGQGHAWNAVLINKQWYLIDATWASGYFAGDRFKRQRNDHYYLTPPTEFIKDHFPDDAQWQLLDKPIDKKTYIGLAK